MNWGARIAIGLIRGYQLCVSPFLGKRCRFYPSCSQYAILALTEWGFFRGLGLAARRLAKCGPWHGGGFDPVPARKTKDTDKFKSACSGTKNCAKKEPTALGR